MGANGGTNFGLKHAGADVILCIDADSRLSRDSLKRLASHLDDPTVGGVSGQITSQEQNEPGHLAASVRVRSG